MNILIVGIVNNPQAARLQEEAEKRGHTLTRCYSTDLLINSSVEQFEAKIAGVDISRIDVMYLMAISKRRHEWVLAANFFKQKNKIQIVNDKLTGSALDSNPAPAVDYYFQYRIGLPFPKSAIVFNYKSFDQIKSEFSYPMIIKSSNGRQGKGVHLINSAEEARKVFQENKDNETSLVVREYIPNDGDIRVFTVGYKAIGAMKRTPPEGDFRSNISVGGQGAVFDLTANPLVQNIAENASKITKTQIAGVDIMLHKETGKPYILEVNPGPQFTGLEKFTGVNAAGKIIEYFESLV